MSATNVVATLGTPSPESPRPSNKHRRLTRTSEAEIRSARFLPALDPKLSTLDSSTIEAEISTACLRPALNSKLSALDQRNEERRAIQEGIDAWRAGDVQDLDEFDCEFRSANGIR